MIFLRRIYIPVFILILLTNCGAKAPQLNLDIQNEYPIVVIGATPSGIMAAIAAARSGTNVLLLESTDHVGGIVTNGLTIADIVKRNSVGGLFDEYTQRIVKYYELTYGKNSQQVIDCKKGEHPEPHVTELVFNQMLREESRIRLIFRQRLKRAIVNGNTLVQVIVEDLNNSKKEVQYSGKVFIDATYEGDLAAAAGVKYRIGRESRSEFGEPQAGVIYSRFGKNEYLPGSTGEADNAIQAFCFRLSMTREPNNRVPITKPENYNREEYVHFIEDIKAGKLAPMIPSESVDRDKLMQPVQLWKKPNNKVEVNSEHVEPTIGAPRESSDLAEENFTYPEGSYEEREKIFNRYWNYQMGIFWFLQNDPEVPESYRKEAAQWGFCKDEFVTNNHKPRQIYVRETRRIEGEYFLTQKDGDIIPEVNRTKIQPQSIAISEYPFDCHGCHKYDSKHPYCREGYFYVKHAPFQVPFGTLIPKQIDGLIVPVCLSASHVAFQSNRMEPLWMWYGQVAGIAANQSLINKKTVRNISVLDLQKKLIQQRGVITYLENLDATDKDYPALQFLATYGEIKGYKLVPEARISETEAVEFLKKITKNLSIKWQESTALTGNYLTKNKLEYLLKTKVSSKNAELTVRDFSAIIYQKWGN